MNAVFNDAFTPQIFNRFRRRSVRLRGHLGDLADCEQELWFTMDNGQKKNTIYRVLKPIAVKRIEKSPNLTEDAP